MLNIKVRVVINPPGIIFLIYLYIYMYKEREKSNF